MALALTIRGKLFGLSLLGLALVLGAGGVGTVAVGRLQAANAQVLQAGTAVKAQMQADMMHDALRGDVLRAQLAALRGDGAAAQETASDLAEHAKTFAEAMDALAAIDLGEPLKQEIARVRPMIDRYVASAREAAARPAAGAEADAQLAAFQRHFAELEDAMGALGEHIVERADALQDDGERFGDHARWAIAAAALLAGALLFAAGWHVSRSIVRPIGRAVQVAQAVAAGDLRSRIDARGHDETAELLKALDAMNGNLVSLVGEVRASSADIAAGSGDVAHGSADLSRRTAETVGQLQGAASSMDRLNGVLGASADAATQAGALAASASRVAEQGGTVVAQVVQAMEDIEARSRRIEDIVGTIDGIAFQTNILALNAAVEAARAGEQGRGFAVVAGEVRSLAQRASGAAREIKALIGSSVERVHDGARLVADAGRTMDEIVASVRRVDAIVGDITRAAADQRDGIGQVNDAVGRLGEMSQHNAALVDRSADAAQRLKSQADRLSTLVGTFQLEGG